MVAVTLLVDPLGDRDQLTKTVLIALTWTADLAYSLPTVWAGCFVVGGAARVHRERFAVPAWAAPAALAVLLALSVVPLRGHALTYLAGGPAIAVLTAVTLLAWRGWTDVTQPALRPLVPAESVAI